MTNRDLKLVSYDGNAINDGTNYTAGLLTGREWGLPRAKAKRVKRWGSWAWLSGIDRGAESIDLFIKIENSDKRTYRDQLLRWFDPEDETPKQLVVEDEDGTGDRYKYVICEQLEPLQIGGYASQDTFVTRLAVHGDARWRKTSVSTDTWNITATGQTNNVTNGGSDDAWPVFRIKPTTGKTGGYDYKRFLSCAWRTEHGGARYPVMFGPIDTSTLIAGGKMQADGDDFRVLVDGIETDRWLVSLGTASTYVWIIAHFAPMQSGSLKTAIPASGSISSIELLTTDDTSGFPDEGLLIIDSEIFAYSSKNNADSKFTNITRGAKGTSQAAHSAGTTVYWLQHEIEMLYGNSSATTPSTNGDNEPAFVYQSSSNTEWLYSSFGETRVTRPGQWFHLGPLSIVGKGGTYNAHHRTHQSGVGIEHAELGAWLGELHGSAYGWIFSNPCGVVNAAWTDGEKRAVVTSDFVAHCRYWIRGEGWWTNQYTIPDPSAANTWESWSKAYDGTDWNEADTLALILYFHPSDVEVNNVTVKLSSTETPATSVGAEQSNNYSLDCTITNNTTGEAIKVKADVALNQELEIDTYNETVTYLADGTNQFQAIELVGGVRDRWLKLLPGTNQLQFDDTGTVAVTFYTDIEARYY